MSSESQRYWVVRDGHEAVSFIAQSHSHALRLYEQLSHRNVGSHIGTGERVFVFAEEEGMGFRVVFEGINQ